MDQIRELLIGDFIQDTNKKLEVMQERLDDIQEDYREDIERLSNNFNAKIMQMDKVSSDKYEYLERQIDEKIKGESKRSTTHLEVLKEELNTHKEYSDKSLSMFKKIYDAKLQALRDEHSQKSVSKTSLASMFLEYSLKLKDSNIENEIKSEITKDIIN